MRQTLFLIAAITAGWMPLCGQETQKPPLPSGPLLNRTPAHSAWVVISQNAAADNAVQNQNPASARSEIVKTGDTIREVATDAKGVRQEIWWVGELRITKVPDAPTPLIFPDFGGGDIYSVDYKTSDFSGFHWISPSSYAGVETWQGKKCLVFKGKVSPLTELGLQQQAQAIAIARELGEPVPAEVLVPAVAYIDVQTRLPLFAQFGGEKRTYQYGPAPTAPLQLPQEVVGPLQEYLVRMKRLTAPPTKAY